MVSLNDQLAASHPNAQASSSLSYKFQRLRERLRQAILSGQLTGRLPGERILARQFDANPKTLSKALTDLAAEGLLERSIGRGTYVKGALSQPAGGEGRWLVLQEEPAINSPVLEAILAEHPDAQLSAPQASFRPSFINQFSAVIDLAGGNAALHRDLAVRGMPSIIVGREPSVYRTNAVLLDREHAAYCLGRQLLLEGHSRLIAVERPEETLVSTTLRSAVQRYAPEATVESRSLDTAVTLIDAGTAFVCDGAELAGQLAPRIGQQQTTGSGPALTAIGYASQPPCRGYFVRPQAVATAVIDVLRDSQPHHPCVLWLLGEYFAQAAPNASSEARCLSLTA